MYDCARLADTWLNLRYWLFSSQAKSLIVWQKQMNRGSAICIYLTLSTYFANVSLLGRWPPAPGLVYAVADLLLFAYILTNEYSTRAWWPRYRSCRRPRKAQGRRRSTLRPVGEEGRSAPRGDGMRFTAVAPNATQTWIDSDVTETRTTTTTTTTTAFPPTKFGGMHLQASKLIVEDVSNA